VSDDRPAAGHGKVGGEVSGEVSGEVRSAAEVSGEPDDEERAADAARAALARARAAAAARGLRPGGPLRARRRRLAGEPRVSGAAADDRDPQELAAGLERLVSERGWGLDLAVGGVLGRWPQVVGPQLAAHCRPESFDDGLLVVRADSTAWATQVRLLAPTVLRRLAEELGDGVVEQLRVQGPSAPSWRRGSRSVRGRGPRDTYG
jgi:predicted nucleic acid-binding Zn ribbon protein